MPNDLNLKKPNLSVEERLRILDEKKKKIIYQNREKTKRVNQKRLLEIGRLIEKAKLQDLDNQLLLGAFLEIAEKSQDKKNHSLWKTKASSNENQDARIIINFNEKISTETKNILKSLGFRWNSIRNEYYGRGTLENIKLNFKSIDCNIESIP